MSTDLVAIESSALNAVLAELDARAFEDTARVEVVVMISLDSKGFMTYP